MKVNTTNGIVAKGYDLIEFFNGKTVKGSSEISFKLENRTFLFDTIANRTRFVNNIEGYMPQYGGFCAIAMSEGKEANPNPKSFLVENNKLYFFTKILFGIIDAKRQWVKNPSERSTLADHHWDKIKNDR